MYSIIMQSTAYSVQCVFISVQELHNYINNNNNNTFMFIFGHCGICFSTGPHLFLLMMFQLNLPVA